MVLFGEVVMYKRMIKHKGSKVFEQGIWCGKHSFNDCHIVLTPEGACEARTIRRLAPEQAFDGPAHHHVQRIAMGLLTTGHSHEAWRPSSEVPTTNIGGMRFSQKSLMTLAQTVAAGLVTPAPGLHVWSESTRNWSWLHQQHLHCQIHQRRGNKRMLKMAEVLKRQDTTESPRKSAEKREAEEAEEEAEKRQKIEESSEGQA